MRTKPSPTAFSYTAFVHAYRRVNMTTFAESLGIESDLPCGRHRASVRE
jgi:hypothetical protein